MFGGSGVMPNETISQFFFFQSVMITFFLIQTISKRFISYYNRCDYIKVVHVLIL